MRSTFFPQAAKRAGWIVNDHSPCPLSHVGFGLVQADDSERFQTLSTKDVSLVNLFDEAKSRCKAVLVEQGMPNILLFWLSNQLTRFDFS